MQVLSQAVDLGLYEQATNLILAVGAYAGLAASTQRDDPAWAKMEADLRARTSTIGAETLFLTLEINASGRLGAGRRPARLARGREMAPVAAPGAAGAAARAVARPRAPPGGQGARRRQLGAPVRRDPGQARLPCGRRGTDPARGAEPPLRRRSRAKRKTVADALSKALGERAPTLALALNTLAFEKQVEDRWRKYPTPVASRHIANEVDAEAVDAMEAAVVEAYPRLSHRYYALKAKAMGVDALDYWDRNAPLDQAPPRRYDWAAAKAVVLDSTRALAPKFAAIGETFFANPWIDAEPRAGKSSGAYSHPVTSTKHPYVFMNYMDERRDVLTLAHELGHAVHQTLAAPLGTLLSDTPLTLGRDRLDLRRGAGVRAAAGRRHGQGAPRAAGGQDRGRAEHRGPPDRLPPFRDQVPRPARRRASYPRTRSARCGWRCRAKASARPCG